MRREYEQHLKGTHGQSTQQPADETSDGRSRGLAGMEVSSQHDRGAMEPCSPLPRQTQVLLTHPG